MQPSGYYESYWKDAPQRYGADDAGAISEHGNLDPAVQALYERLIPRGARVLDVGCGDGRTSGSWLTANGRAYVGVDVSETGVESARARGLEAQRIEDAAQLPFPDGSFDAIVCTEVLEHLFLPQQAAAEMRRVLKDGGVLIATVPNIGYLKRRVELGLFGVFNPFGDDLSSEQPWRDPHIRFFTPATLARMLTLSGFQQVQVEGHQGLIGRLPARLRSGSAASLLARRLHAHAIK